MRHLFAPLVSLVLIACAGPARMAVDNLGGSAQTPVEDLRPASEGTKEIFSLLITSDQYGYTRLADNVTDPTRVRLFAHRLQEKYEADPVPSTKLLHFVVYLNNRAQLKRSSLGAAFGGALGGAVASGAVKEDGGIVHTSVDPEIFAALSGESEYKRALYSESELPAGSNAFVIYIETEVAGQRRFTRTVAPGALTAAMDSAIHYHLNP